jgi:hypothetical protein
MHRVTNNAKTRGVLLGCLLLVAFLAAMVAKGAGPKDRIKFDMVPSTSAATCLPNAKGHVVVQAKRGVEKLKLKVEGLPPKTEFNFFVIQVPNAPFGLSWYQGDLETNHDGKAELKVVGRFNVETFVVAPGSAAAPHPHAVDATSNPATGPVHTYHLGLWFDSPAAATAAGCPGATTPFSGEHTAGIQVLSTRNFPDLAGPLSQLG